MNIEQCLNTHGSRLAQQALGQILTEGMPRQGNVNEEWLRDFLGRWGVWRWVTGPDGASAERCKLLQASQSLVSRLRWQDPRKSVLDAVCDAANSLGFPQKFSAISKVACAYFPDRVFVQDSLARAGFGLRHDAGYPTLYAEAQETYQKLAPSLAACIADAGITPALAHLRVSEQALKMRLLDCAAMEAGRHKLGKRSGIP